MDALAFVREHGVVLVSARGPAPRLTEFVAGEAVKGSWWGHAKGKQIFAALQALSASPEVLVCRLVDDKLTLVHSRLWPALAAAAPLLAPARTCRVEQEHMRAGHHENHVIDFPDWVPAEVLAEAAQLAPEAALAALGPAVKPSLRH